MVPSLRPHLALVALISLFLIPLVTSSLNGLTHVITCSADAKTPFTVNVAPSGPPTITSAETFDRGTATGLCGGLSLAMGVTTLQHGSVRVLLPITNHSRYRWHGTIRLVLSGVSVPVSLGSLDPGTTRVTHVDLNLGGGETQITGSLLIGP